MLKALQKALGVKPEANETLEIKLDTAEIQAAIKAAVDAASTEFAEFKQTAEALLAVAETENAELVAKLEAATAQLAEAAAAFADAEAAKVEAEAAALAAKMAARKEKVVAVIGTERADALLTVTEGLDDAAFEAIVSALGTGAAAEEAGKLFNEVGADAQADGTQVVESKEMKILREKYPAAK